MKEIEEKMIRETVEKAKEKGWPIIATVYKEFDKNEIEIDEDHELLIINLI